MNDRYEHLLRKSRDAKRGGYDAWVVQSTGEKVAVALVLNRADWLAEIDYTIPEAIDRSGADWVAVRPQGASHLAEEELQPCRQFRSIASIRSQASSPPFCSLSCSLGQLPAEPRLRGFTSSPPRR